MLAGLHPKTAQLYFMFTVFVVWCLVLLPQHSRVPGSIPGWSLSVHVLPVDVWVLFGYSFFLPLTKNKYVRLINDSKIDPRTECECR